MLRASKKWRDSALVGSLYGWVVLMRRDNAGQKDTEQVGMAPTALDGLARRLHFPCEEFVLDFIPTLHTHTASGVA